MNQSFIFISMTMIKGEIEKTTRSEEKEEDTHEDFELPIFDQATILRATNNFSFDNKLGEGGFGPVYKVNLQHF
jgi:hypothetical protein